MGLEALKKVVREHALRLLALPNVTSVGIGHKWVKGINTKRPALVVGVTQKLSLEALQPEARIPQIVEGQVTDVQAVGQIQATPGDVPLDPKARNRPPFPGCSLGHPSITAGTFGCVLIRDPDLVILSNNHVMAASNDAQIGDPILQPGKADGGTSDDSIATLLDFVPVKFIGGEGSPECPWAKGLAAVANWLATKKGSTHRFRAYQIAPQETPTNRVDAAIALPTVPIDAEIPHVGIPAGTVEADLGMVIQKYGRTTEHTTDQITQVAATVQVSYGLGKTAIFEDQLVAGPMSAGGDSGSAVCDASARLVGLLFAGSEATTVLSPIQAVLDVLNLRVPEFT